MSDRKLFFINHDLSRSIAKALTALLPEYGLKREDLFITSKIPTFIPHWPDWPSLADCANGLEVKKICILHHLIINIFSKF